MQKKFLMRFGFSFSDSRKSKIQNRKWVGIVVLAVTFLICGAVAQAQQPAEISKIGWLAARPPSGPTGGT